MKLMIDNTVPTRAWRFSLVPVAALFLSQAAPPALADGGGIGIQITPKLFPEYFEEEEPEKFRGTTLGEIPSRLRLDIDFSKGDWPDTFKEYSRPDPFPRGQDYPKIVYQTPRFSGFKIGGEYQQKTGRFFDEEEANTVDASEVFNTDLVEGYDLPDPAMEGYGLKLPYSFAPPESMYQFRDPRPEEPIEEGFTWGEGTGPKYQLGERPEFRIQWRFDDADRRRPDSYNAEKQRQLNQLRKELGGTFDKYVQKGFLKPDARREMEPPPRRDQVDLGEQRQETVLPVGLRIQF